MKAAKKRLQKAAQLFRKREHEFHNTLCGGLYAISAYIKKTGATGVTVEIKNGVVFDVYATK